MNDLVTRTAEAGETNGGVHSRWEPLREPFLRRERAAGARSWRSVCGFPILDPRDSKIVKVANIVVEWLDATYTAFKVPVGVAVYQDCRVLGIFTLCDILAGIILLVVVWIRFHTAKLECKKNEERIIPDGKTIAAEYIRRGTFVIDVVSLLPFFVQVILLIMAAADGGSAFKALTFAMPFLNALRLVRLLFVFSIVKSMFVESLGGDLGGKLLGLLPVWAVHLVDLLYAMFVLINLMGSLFLFTAYTEGLDGRTWLNDVGGVDLRPCPTVDKYVAAIHFAMTTMATVGYGDVAPRTRIERLVAMVIMAFGLLFFGLLISAVGALLKDASTGVRRAHALRKKMNEVDAYAEARKLPEVLRQELFNYYQDVWFSYQEVHEAEILKELPVHLRAKLVCHVLRDVFENSYIFQGIDEVTKMDLAAVLSPVVVLPSHDLCRAGDRADCLWFLQDGTLEMISKGVTHTKLLAAPAVVGESAMLTQSMPELARRSASFRALGRSCTAWRLSMDDLQVLLDSKPNLKDILMAGLAKSLRTAPTPAQSLWREAFQQLARRSSDEVSIPSVAAPSGTSRGAGGSAMRSVAHSHDVFEHALGENRELPRRIVRVLSGRARDLQGDNPHGPLFDFEGSSR
ncbi:Potassium voltage-gated channel subfamily H member 7 [Coccomyxa sp. Obi]|nr:Potassium voltage-gated channel subfamily H member 7 [Coccomyxa sp. Obi]